MFKQIRKIETSNRSFNIYLLSTYFVLPGSWIVRIKAGTIPALEILHAAGEDRQSPSKQNM